MKGFFGRGRGSLVGEGVLRRRRGRGLPLGEAPPEMTEGLAGKAHMTGKRRAPRKGASFSFQ